ncbi:hypothetical protein HK096_007318 [Nowakowskiella sp. JEL0078]|nr:hypothetical protein HK096_007318 [Nowakowskiella sp. JEL0078]
MIYPTHSYKSRKTQNPRSNSLSFSRNSPQDNFNNTRKEELEISTQSSQSTPSHTTVLDSTEKFSDSSSNIRSKSQIESLIKINEVAAEFWQPEHYHMMRPDARLDNLRRFHNIEKSPYPLPADINEQDRLEAQHLVTTYSFGSLFKMPIEEIISKSGSKILDVGCGPGSWTRDVATAYPLCEVHAVDMAKTLFHGVEILPNTFFAEGNVMERLPCHPFKKDPDNYFDAVFQRYLILAIPKEKWDFVISELVRVTKLGGFVECVEVNIAQAFILRGLDLDIYWNLPSRFKKAGLEFVSETPASIPIGWSGKVGELHLVNVKLLIDALKPFLMKAFNMDKEALDKMNEEVVEEYSIFKSYWNCISVVGKKI